jgi:1,2-diacylglycerol 3-alpha-glucosyltransferase
VNIVHIAPNAPYNEGWGYQENLLPKYHKRLGHHVSLIITNMMHKDGKIVEVGCGEYFNDNGIRIIRLNRVNYYNRSLTNIFSDLRVDSLLTEIDPDIVFFHGLISNTIFDVIRFKKRKEKFGQQCIILQDNHLDYNNSKSIETLKGRILRYYYRILNQRTQNSITKIFGVTPWRVEYARDYFCINQNKLDLLMMGADDDSLDFPHFREIRNRIRKTNAIQPDDFLIVTGGKLDQKKGLIPLMRAINEFHHMKLLVFGSVMKDIEDEFNELLSPNITYVGWVEADKVYEYFFSADLAFFPGGHSVLWEQACASKIPCVFKKWDGMEHVDNGGNAEFINLVTTESIKSILEELFWTKKYFHMLEVARSEKTDIYLYSRIAERSLQIYVD